MAGLLMLRKYYNASMPGFSIPATEHSTITSWGRNQELEACKNFVEAYSTGILDRIDFTFNLVRVL